jgi:hypothetical protein
MNAKTTQTFENLSLRSVTDCAPSLRPMLAGAWCVSRRSMRFGDPLALPAVGFLHRIGA